MILMIEIMLIALTLVSCYVHSNTDNKILDVISIICTTLSLLALVAYTIAVIHIGLFTSEPKDVYEASLVSEVIASYSI